MLIHNTGINNPFLQKWRKVSNSVHTSERFHTWHDSKEAALQFIGMYYKNLGSTAPKNYLIPEGDPTRQANSMNEPTDKFLKDGAIIVLAPLLT